ncbi:MAG: UDP-N-acetylmuramoyl-L-alanyl-D-glutamate--2,6-diaminopimelate ligase [Pelagibacteraceae bacterium]|nr:MAG: UDP-N-acetylmuramoyl-L-alanyl-D-glutamate--2,6-diaminopimelate ligase [Pelagibacteraceae bacterium]
MILKDYFSNIKKNYQNFFFSNIALNSSEIKKNYIFFAIKGNQSDGNKFINQAIKKGAKIIISEIKFTGIKNGILFLNSKNIRKLLAETSYKIYNKVPKTLIAVTGTNGKSSIADFYYQILKLNKKKVASIGTLGLKTNNYKKNLLNTTIDSIQLAKILSNLTKKNINHVILEASSHGLKQNRLDGLLFDVGIFTNLSHDHLDYHKNLNSYLNAKLYLFKKLIKKNGIIISDENIPEYKKIKKISVKKKLKLYSILNNQNNFELMSHQFQDESQILNIRLGKNIYKLVLNLIGKIQLKNILMAIMAASKTGINIKKILKIIPKIKSVNGRLEKIGKIKNNSKVILDYAHTPDALMICLKNLREQFPNKKISVLFGCGGNRDQRKRAKMGKIADIYSDQIYLTDDNPRFESPSKIRSDIKKGIKKQNPVEISSREKAILSAINDLNTGDILLVAGKGHEKIQDFGNKKILFSDKKIIIKAIKIKNFSLSKNLKLNIIKELSKNKNLNSNLVIRNCSIDSRVVKKNDIFFAIKGKKNDGNKYIDQAFKNKASLAIVNNLNKKYNLSKQIKVTKTLDFLTESSKIYRENLNAKIITITGSCGKTTLKDLLAHTLKKLFKVSFSPKSYNNKYGVPLSLFNLNQKDDFGILEVGMDKKGEIDYLSNIIKPDLGVITNINYAHAKNFKNIKQIALAKSEIIKNIKDNGYIVLNADDNFYNLHKKIALSKKLHIFSFGINNKQSETKLLNIKKLGKKFIAKIKINNLINYFYLPNNFESNILNFLAAITVMNIFFDVSKLNKNIFFDFKVPNGRGDISKIKINNKKIFLVDESYNSNPLSLKSAIINFDKLNSGNSRKYLILGDMLELGKYSLMHHKTIAKIINSSKIHKTYIIGKKVIFTFDKISKHQKGGILTNTSEIIDLIKNVLKKNDYLMIKGSNSTGLHKFTNNLKGLK